MLVPAQPANPPLQFDQLASEQQDSGYRTADSAFGPDTNPDLVTSRILLAVASPEVARK